MHRTHELLIQTDEETETIGLSKTHITSAEAINISVSKQCIGERRVANQLGLPLQEQYTKVRSRQGTSSTKIPS